MRTFDLITGKATDDRPSVRFFDLTTKQWRRKARQDTLEERVEDLAGLVFDLTREVEEISDQVVFVSLRA